MLLPFEFVTTEGFAGGDGLQRIGITPASTDPVVSTIFVTEAENFGEGVLYIAKNSDLSGANILEGNVLSALECEVGVELLPEEFASKASIKITSEQARNILKEMGVDVPAKIYDKAGIDSALKSTPRLSKEQITEFIQKVLGITN